MPLLADDDPRALQTLNESNPVLQAALDTHWRDFKRQINAFDLAGALDTLNAARAEIDNLKEQ